MGQGLILQHNTMGVGWRKETTGLGSSGNPWVWEEIKWQMTVFNLSRRGRRPQLVAVGL